MPSKNIPRHLAIIMDGNRRWAKKRGKPPFYGHKVGYETFSKIAQACLTRGIKILTVYAFSTENWKRSAQEIALLFKLLERGLKKEKNRLLKEGISLRILGDIEKLPASLQKIIKEVVFLTKKNKKGILNLALNYGGQKEILDAIKKIMEKKIPLEDISERTIEDYLYTAGEPAPDLIIRTGGVRRISNFLLWQGAYSELYFTDTLWPDFTERELDQALEDFSCRQRRFGA